MRAAEPDAAAGKDDGALRPRDAREDVSGSGIDNGRFPRLVEFGRIEAGQQVVGNDLRRLDELGSASRRERVCQYVYISVVAVYYKKNKQPHCHQLNTTTTVNTS